MAAAMPEKTEQRVTVPAAEDMGAQTFRMHCQARHPLLRFWALRDHNIQHAIDRSDGNEDHIHRDRTHKDVIT